MLRAYLSFLFLLLFPISISAQSLPSVNPTARTENWWIKRHQDKLIEIKKKNFEIIMLGDSITHFWEHRGKPVWNEFYKTRTVLNLGFSGDRTENLLWRIKNGEISGQSPKLVVLMIGTNNTGTRWDSSESTVKGIQVIVDEIKKHLTEAKILVYGVFPRGVTSNDKYRKRNDEVNIKLKNIADNKRVFYLNINNLYLSKKGTLSSRYMYDLLHPTAYAYKIWAQSIKDFEKEHLLP